MFEGFRREVDDRQAEKLGALAPKTGKLLGDNPFVPQADPVRYGLWREAYFKAQIEIDGFKHYPRIAPEQALLKSKSDDAGFDRRSLITGTGKL
ncbi:hypothetical protein AM571_PC00446 (plasmid) [Rhizobium etli 8C-3]|uniref:Uncharacterized protein n=2 Tax=Rhizobium TaxID=379 RepID=A0A4R3S0U9_9HYPH|nr:MULTISPECIES: hypothetical protein [Rhizobium]APO78185.1 hypothetical protein AM571_PC00446 [Rhizobium etli 8C-3]TCU31148.1 hypothetical protein EV130_101724 [Rhizobium azibense]TCU40839.1 hypothetical protein EV129_101125 [Rhizobium azibense]